ncbi:LysR family transcriptional regulator ArgP [Shimia marina]|uniref:Putative HTH-type transcriptional regulatorc/MT2039 n=1 Tax=Shimia marina TaxID=321267 RepID=A0A0P1ES86_9RHOB|nr:LysR family transcriptional regulator ArgP [Shimia marina]CUH52791.1 putative HTH-type transcriptional regulatorc/MT2039 [Shimia marina]SFD87871.1 LysR family transcriptional regulator, chromosome initiation inhibitor [Shimia marina]
MQIDYAHLAALAAILRTGSFDAAAQDLGVTQSAISQRLKALEERIGMPLVLRGSPCVGTETGRRLAAHLDQVGLLEGALARDLAALSPRSARLRIAVTADSLATFFLKAVAQVPDLLVDLVVDDQDFSADWLRRGEVVAAVTAHEAPIAGCDSLPLGAMRYIASASPAFVKQHFANGVTPEAISKAPVLIFSSKDRLQHQWMQQTLGITPTPPSHHLPSAPGFVDASLLGLGWGMNPEPLVRPHLNSGALVPLLPDTPFDTPLFWQSSRLLAPALAPLSKALQQIARQHLN